MVRIGDIRLWSSICLVFKKILGVVFSIESKYDYNWFCFG